MNLNQVNIYFYVKKSRTKGKRGHLYVRVTVNGEKMTSSVKSMAMYPHEFDVVTQNPTKKCDLYFECNNFMVGMRQEINKIHNEFEKKKFLFTNDHLRKAIEDVYHRVKYGREADAKTFIDVYNAFLLEEEKKVGLMVSDGTHKVRKRYLRIAERVFQKAEILSMPICNITEDNLKLIQLELMSCYAKGTAARVWNVFCMVFKYAKKKKDISENPCDDLQAISEDKTPDLVWLEQDEIKALAALNLTGSLNDYRNAFLFCCYTGLCIGDYGLLNPATQEEQIKKAKSPVDIVPGKITNTVDGVMLIGNRRKTGTQYRVPVTDETKKIIDIYGGIEKMPFSLPKTGLALNALMKMIECNKVVRFHTARGTMANYLLNVMVMNPFYVIAIMGWKKIEESEPYTIVSNSVLSSQMLRPEPSNLPRL